MIDFSSRIASSCTVCIIREHLSRGLNPDTQWITFKCGLADQTSTSRRSLSYKHQPLKTSIGLTTRTDLWLAILLAVFCFWLKLVRLRDRATPNLKLE
jgi:hypothetical protein